MKKTVILISIFLILILSTVFFAKKTTAQSDDMWMYVNDAPEPAPAPEPAYEPVQVDESARFSSAEAASDTGNYVGAMMDDARANNQTVSTTTGYEAFTQNGYVYRMDPDGRGFSQYGANYETGALIDPATGKAVDYIRDYDITKSPIPGGSGDIGAGITASGENVSFAPGNDFVKLEDNTYAWKMSNGEYMWYDSATGTMNPVDMSGVSGSAAAGASGASGERDLVGTTSDGYPVYADKSGNHWELRSDGFYPLEGTTGIAINPLQPGEQTAASQITSGTIKTDPSTGVATFTDGTASYRVDKNSAGQMFYTNSAGQQVLLGQSGGVAYGVPASSIGALSSGGGILGSVGNFVGGLLGLSGGIGYNKAMGGIYGGLGFNSVTGSGASSGGGLLSSLIGGGGGTATSGGFSYIPGQGWSGGVGFSSGTGTAGYSGTMGYGGGYMGGMGGGGMGWNPANYIGTGLPAGSIYNIIQGIVFWILAIFGFICIIGFVIAGIMYLLAAGDEKSQEKAKKAMYYSITGVIVGLVGLVIIFAVNALLRGGSYF